MRDLKFLLPCLIAAACAATGCVSQTAALVSPESAITSQQGWPKADVTRLANAAPGSILFIGNSYFYYNDSLHNHLNRMMQASGQGPDKGWVFKSSTIGGAALFDQPIDHLLVPANLRVDRPFEVVIMAGQSNAALTPERRALFAQTAAQYAAKVRAAGGEPVLYMTHAYVPPHRQARPDMIDDVAALYVETGNDIDALVIPVGLAFAQAYRRRPDIKLHKSYDGSHPSLLGTYLAAATTMASLYGISPVGNGYDYFGEIDPADARFLQEVAQDTVTRFYKRSK